MLNRWNFLLFASLIAGSSFLDVPLLATPDGNSRWDEREQGGQEDKEGNCSPLASTSPQGSVSSLQGNSPSHSTRNGFQTTENCYQATQNGNSSRLNSQLAQLSTARTKSDPAMAQVTSVSQLRDIEPTAWAYQALGSLVERYGCIVGYPNLTFRGEQAIARWEFAAGLNACLNSIERLVQENASVLKEDLEILKRLAQEFQSELAALGTRSENLENRTAYVEDHQFSTTTKLTGLTWFNLTGAFVDGSVKAERRFADNPFAAPGRDPETNKPTVFERKEPNITFSYYTWLTLTTSFTGKDSLVTQLVAGNADSPANELVSAGFYNSWGTPFLDQTGTLGTNNVVIRDFFYQFPVGDSVRVVVGPRINFYRYFDGNRFTFFLNGATGYNSTGSTLSNPIDRGSGAVVIWDISKQLDLTVAYLGQNTEFLSGATNTASDPDEGLFNPTNTITAQVVYSPSNNFNLRFLYTHSNLRAFNGLIGGAGAEPLPYGFADDGFGGLIENPSADTFVFNFDWLITDNFGIFGRYSYGSTQIEPVNRDRAAGDINVQSIQFGFGFPDLGKEGALAVFSLLIPHDYLDGRRFLLSGAGDGGTQYELEASYYYPITKNIAIVPALYVIWNPNNFESNPTVFVGNFRAQFAFRGAGGEGVKG